VRTQHQGASECNILKGGLNKINSYNIKEHKDMFKTAKLAR